MYSDLPFNYQGGLIHSFLDDVAPRQIKWLSVVYKNKFSKSLGTANIKIYK